MLITVCTQCRRLALSMKHPNFQTPQGSKTPEQIDIKLDRGDYVQDLTAHSNFGISTLMPEIVIIRVYFYLPQLGLLVYSLCTCVGRPISLQQCLLHSLIPNYISLHHISPFFIIKLFSLFPLKYISFTKLYFHQILSHILFPRIFLSNFITYFILHSSSLNYTFSFLELHILSLHLSLLNYIYLFIISHPFIPFCVTVRSISWFIIFIIKFI